MINSIPQNGAAIAPPTAAPARTLRGITKGKIEAPMRVLVYSQEGVGKSTFAAGCPGVVFLGKEGGTEQLDVHRMPEPTHWRDAPIERDGLRRDCFSLIEDLLHAPHDYTAVAIDTLDWIEPLMHKWVCQNSMTGGKSPTKKPVQNLVEAFGGYGKGYEVAVDQFRTWIALLDRLRVEKRMHIIMLAHAHIKKMSNPEGDDYDTFQLKMQEKAAGLFREWSDVVMFAKLEQFVLKKKTEEDDSKKRYAIGEGVRFGYTSMRPAYYAKNRFNLPEQLPLEWATFEAAVKRGAPASAGEIVAKIKEIAGFTSVDTQKDVDAMLARAGLDVDKLVRVLNWTQSQVDETAQVATTGDQAQ